ncbi:hypothetical protein P7A99_11205 [Caulobacter endophyticus]|nr:hypothetical protein [Caulobacter endophyticus]MDG2529310.1 hypothetical protein [Caulobacter endophyticus]
MEKVFVAQRVANKLWATENAVDGAMVQAAELMADLLKARKDLGLSAVVGDKASAKLVEALAALGEARSAMVDMHNELSEVKLRVGIRTKLVGVEEKTEEDIKTLGSLRGVA